ncbi:MAG: helicase C-terminal domain-containing protein [Candidatus Binatia bacterium]
MIRSRDDYGVVAILDSRIIRRGYGESFLASLPPARLSTGPLDAMVVEVARFLG